MVYNTLKGGCTLWEHTICIGFEVKAYVVVYVVPRPFPSIFTYP